MSDKRRRQRMTSHERREQLIAVARAVFGSKTFEAATVEEIAAEAGVSKPVVYEHFGGKEGLYAVVVDREVNTLLDAIRTSLTTPQGPRQTLEAATIAFLDYVETNSDGFRILGRDSAVGSGSGSFATILNDIASEVEGILADQFRDSELDPKMAPMYAQMLTGMVAMTGQWWLDARRPSKADVAAHVVNLAWNGLRGLRPQPRRNR